MIKEEIVNSLDIGTSKICGMACIMRESGPEVIAVKTKNLSGEIVKKGRVSDIEEVSNCVYDVLRDLRSESGDSVPKVNLSIGGGHIKGALIAQTIPIEPHGREIIKSDILTLTKEIENKISATHGIERTILFTSPQEFIVDKINRTKKEPLGMHGDSLEMKVHVLTAGVNPVKDLVTCVQKAGALVEGLYPHSWAVAEATISEEEKKLGCIVLDFGKGTTDIIYYSDNLVHKTDSINIGSENIDRDVSTIFQTPLFRAEELKKQYAYANFPILAKENSSILSKEAEIFNLSGKMINKTTVKKISHVAYARVLEVFELHMKQAIGKDKIEHNCAAGIIISGGGAKLIGINQMVETFFRVPVKTGVPTGVMNLDKNFQSPEFASLVGTLLLATKKSRSSENKGFIPQALERIGNVFKRWF